MTSDFFFRTEDIRREDVLGYFVPSAVDNDVVAHLRSRTPVVIEGSRGVGKSFLMRVAEAKMRAEFASDHDLPVYFTFAVATLIADPTPARFNSWMMSRLVASTLRAAGEMGLVVQSGSALDLLDTRGTNPPSSMADLARAFEESWRTGVTPEQDTSLAPTAEDLLSAIQEFCEQHGLRRIVLLVDEAAHVFIPDQQRQFFTLMRSLRSPFLVFKAAVYPGVTSYGDHFQPTHDATFVTLDRKPNDADYLSQMREIVLKQDPSIESQLKSNGQTFDVLAFAATGNPRVLLKTLLSAERINTSNAERVFRTYYREEIWSEHSALTDKYPGHEALIDWGRTFVEQEVLPALIDRNEGASEFSSFLWVHRDAPAAVKESLRLLCYSGILQEGTAGIKGTRSEIGTRYIVNLGCQFSLDASPVAYGATITKNLSIRRMVEYGAKHPSYGTLTTSVGDVFVEPSASVRDQLARELDLLDLSPFMIRAMTDLGLKTIGDVLAADDQLLTSAYYVGQVRADRMKNAARAAVYEYLSG